MRRAFIRERSSKEIAVPHIPENIVTALIALISVTAGAMLANALTARRSSDEKIWELRRTAYGIVLAKFVSVDRVLDNADQIISQDKKAGVVSPAAAKYYELLGRYSAEVRGLYADNYLVLSEEFIDLLEEFLRTLDNTDPALNVSEEYEIFAAAVRAARPKLLQQAKSELRLRVKRQLRWPWKRSSQPVIFPAKPSLISRLDALANRDAEDESDRESAMKRIEHDPDPRKL
jgi:hypothetical protein